MPLAEFIRTHVPALEENEVRHNLILGILARPTSALSEQMLTWTLGGPGACAIKWPGRGIILGDLTRGQCRSLAETTLGLDYPDVAGLDLAPRWFAERAGELGLSFAEPIPQRVHVLRSGPARQGAEGRAREVEAADGPLLADWLMAFWREAIPHESMPPRADLEKMAGSGRYLFWVVECEPVSLAGIARRTRNVAAVAPVYTPPARRGRGHAGAVTAALAERLLAEGKTAVCLYTDLRNPASNRCYARIGFTPVCDAWVYLRQ